MPWIDFTHLITPDMPTFPGTPAPLLQTVATVPADFYHETSLHLYSHMGTHVDAPAHIFENGLTLDRLPIECFTGSAVVIPCRGPIVTPDALAPFAQAAEAADFLLFSTGWESRWSDPASYVSDYPVLAPAIADFAAARRKKGVGVDTLSPDRPDALDFHRRFLSYGGGIILENLCHLAAAAPGTLFPLCALPLHYAGADGAPARVIGKVPN